MRGSGCVKAIIIFSGLMLPAFGQPLGGFDDLPFRTAESTQRGLIFGDFDSDDDVDVYDHFTFHICMTTSGPGGAASPACLALDSDADNDVDLIDTAAFQKMFTGQILPVCGNGDLEIGEECDDGNILNADGCSFECRIEIENDYCNNPTPITEGTLAYGTVGATTDGPSEPLDCHFFGNSEIRSDIWYCYTAKCPGRTVISLCGGAYDTKLAVYAGCDCPSSRPLACSDDDCGIGANNDQSRVIIEAVAGQSYMIRAGGFPGNREQGQGLLTVRCGQDTCADGSGDCAMEHQANQPGCDDSACCNRVCDVDKACCDVTWSAFCAAEADGYCSESGFPSCNPQAGTCIHPQNSPGCDNVDCCNAICRTNPTCCISRWDTECVTQSELICANCGAGRGHCHVARAAAGCENTSCCAMVCAVDPYCCTTEWDLTCVQEAGNLCD